MSPVKAPISPVPPRTELPTHPSPANLVHPIRTRRLSVLMSPQKAQIKRSSTPLTASSVEDTTNGPLTCDVCHSVASAVDLVKCVHIRGVHPQHTKCPFAFRCDECLKSYHFGCLEPPLKKTPKRRGYSWHCADCDPTVSDFRAHFSKPNSPSLFFSGQGRPLSTLIFVKKDLFC